jgi:hypothetical protein
MDLETIGGLVGSQDECRLVFDSIQLLPEFNREFVGRREIPEPGDRHHVIRPIEEKRHAGKGRKCKMSRTDPKTHSKDQHSTERDSSSAGSAGKLKIWITLTSFTG